MNKGIFVYNKVNAYVLPTEDIIYLTLEREHTTFYMSDGKRYLSERPMTAQRKRMLGDDFMDAGPDSIVNVKYIKRVDYMKCVLDLNNNTSLPICEQNLTKIVSQLKTHYAFTLEM